MYDPIGDLAYWLWTASAALLLIIMFGSVWTVIGLVLLEAYKVVF